MDTLLIVLQISTLVGLAVTGWLVKSAQSYVNEKAKNLATKEDTDAITRIVEAAKVEYTREIEVLKTTLQRESEVITKRRSVYDELVQGLRYFIKGNKKEAGGSPEVDFSAAYKRAWIWAPDEVIRKFNELIDLNILDRVDVISKKEHQIRDAYITAVISMRRDTGHYDTKLTNADYRFFTLKNEEDHRAE